VTWLHAEWCITNQNRLINYWEEGGVMTLGAAPRSLIESKVRCLVITGTRHNGTWFAKTSGRRDQGDAL
jgi:hypothetical protein